ncbi:MAG: hypothetical protein QOG80_570 [Pseudonocardiales bacterium]|jgi:hypothetical protein|nr:hypothetical protein [Pseudonocardiales bacterium]
MSSNETPRFRLSVVQLLASVLAAATAAVVGSYLGVNGTVIGAAIASLLSVVGTALYSHSLVRTGHHVRAVVPVSARWLPPAPRQPDVEPPAAQRPRTRPIVRIGMAAAVVFVAALAVLTGVELLAGRPVTDLVKGQSANGTTVFGSQQHPTATPTPAVTVTVVPHVVVTTPTVTSTAPAVTVTQTPTTSPSGSTPTAVPTVSPTATTTPSP